MKEPRNGEYWSACSRLTGGVQWQDGADGSGFDYERSVTWAKRPNRYMLTEHANEKKRVLRASKLNTCIFNLSVLSATRVDTGEHDFTRYFVLPDDSVYTVNSWVGAVEDSATAERLVSEFNFVLDNGLMAPNSEDLLVLEYALKNAELDGVEGFTA